MFDEVQSSVLDSDYGMFQVSPPAEILLCCKHAMDKIYSTVSMIHKTSRFQVLQVTMLYGLSLTLSFGFAIFEIDSMRIRGYWRVGEVLPSLLNKVAAAGPRRQTVGQETRHQRGQATDPLQLHAQAHRTIKSPYICISCLPGTYEMTCLLKIYKKLNLHSCICGE
jgi:hypothetical protein